MKKSLFCLKEDGEGRLFSLIHPQDPYAMNWVKGHTPWGTVTVPQWPPEYRSWGAPVKPYGLHVTVKRAATPQGRLRETYTFSNPSDFEIDTLSAEVSIYTPFSGGYESARVCKQKRCHAHIWCGGEVSYAVAWRMGGNPPHLGLVLTQGALCGYSIQRDPDRGSNDRGDILMHPAPMRLAPGASTVVEWELFWFWDQADLDLALAACPRYIRVEASRFIAFEGEKIRLTSSARPALVEEEAGRPGERLFAFQSEWAGTQAKVLVLPPLETLLKRRVRFIAEKQQRRGEGDPLSGAYLIYDNEEGRAYYAHSHDHNAGRERVGMGVLMARYLRSHDDPLLAESLNLYLAYVLRELYDEQSGTVCNDYGRSLDWHRLYNYAWMIQLFTEAWYLTGDVTCIRRAAKALKHFYASGGDGFYPIGLDMPQLLDGLARSGLEGERDEALCAFSRHARRLLERGSDYPALEVRYDQSIVQPAADLMLQAWQLFGDPAYLDSAREHLRLLSLFHGDQPDYHLNRVALRHWDGFWFGKERLLGDTFPHHWSALSGQAFARYARLTGSREALEWAERVLRGPLSLFFADGSASCAMVYPMTVNGRRAHLWDPWANDQDWALYYYLKWHDGLDGPPLDGPAP